MALFEDMFTAKGLVVGLGVMTLAPLAVVSLTGASRPLARAAIKGGMIVYEKGRETAAEFSEVMSDLVAEARAELEHQQAAASEYASSAREEAAPSASAESTGEAAEEGVSRSGGNGAGGEQTTEHSRGEG